MNYDKPIDSADLRHISDHLTNELKYFKNCNIFLTGATGFFGKWILSSIQYFNKNYNTNINVVDLSRNPKLFLSKYPFFNDTNIKFHKGDLKNLNDISNQFDFIIHAGMDVNSSLHKKDQSLIKDEKIIIDQVIDLYNRSNSKKILYTSSGSYYGIYNSNESPPREDFKPRPNNNPYHSAKILSEAKIISSNVNYSIGRCFAFIGPYLPLGANFAAGNFINNLLNNQNIHINSDGKAIRSYLYMADLMIYLFKLLCIQENTIVNIGSDEAITISELANLISKHSTNTKVNVAKKYEGGEINSYFPCTEKLTRMFQHKNISLHDSVARTVGWYLK